MAFTIAVDGPAGAGKSTIAKNIAKALDIIYVDTGAMYRAMGLYFYRLGMDGTDEAKVSEKVADISVKLQYEDGAQCVILNGENVNEYIRTPEISDMASRISSYKAVRAKLVSEQQKLAASASLIMDGRDIGTCVLPNADLKIYLTASAEVRGKRRYDELTAKGLDVSLEEIIKDIEDRDYRDMTRAISPLKQAEDAILVDSSYMTIEEVTEHILKLAADRR